MSGGESEFSISASLGQKRPREEEGDQSADNINICIQNQEGRQICYKVVPATRLQKIFKNFCSQLNMEFSTVSFIYKRHKVNSVDTPAQLKLKDGAVILAALKHDGGGFSG